MKTILVVDDERIVIDVIHTILANTGHRILCAKNSTEAFAVAENNESVIDLLITNHNLKSESGRDVADRLRSLHPHMKVLQISGYFEEDLVHDGTKVPDGSFLQKPFRAAALINIVEMLLAQ